MYVKSKDTLFSIKRYMKLMKEVPTKVSTKNDDKGFLEKLISL